MNKNTEKNVGFTIVELLIVIVVIGILAAIVVVAFNGVQNRAKVSTARTDLSNIAKQAELAKIDNSDAYPTSQSAWSAIFTKAGLADILDTTTAKKQFVACVSPTEFAVIATSPVSSGNADGTTYYFAKSNGGSSSFAFDSSVAGTYQADRLCNQPIVSFTSTGRHWSHTLPK